MKKEIIKVDVTKLMEQLGGRFPGQNREVLKAGARAFVKEVLDNWQDYKGDQVSPSFGAYVKALQGQRPEWLRDWAPARLDVIIGELMFHARKSPAVLVLTAISNIKNRGERLTLESLGREMELGHDATDRAESSRAQKASEYLNRHNLKELFKNWKSGDGSFVFKAPDLLASLLADDPRALPGK